MHTPGPWKEISFGGTLETYYCYIANPEGNYVAAVAKRVDAALIAAAPDLLKALEYILSYDDTVEGADAARAAIAKARG